jgi:hypothetical protein
LLGLFVPQQTREGVWVVQVLANVLVATHVGNGNAFLEQAWHYVLNVSDHSRWGCDEFLAFAAARKAKALAVVFR